MRVSAGTWQTCQALLLHEDRWPSSACAIGHGSHGSVFGNGPTEGFTHHYGPVVLFPLGERGFAHSTGTGSGFANSPHCRNTAAKCGPYCAQWLPVSLAFFPAENGNPSHRASPYTLVILHSHCAGHCAFSRQYKAKQGVLRALDLQDLVVCQGRKGIHTPLAFARCTLCHVIFQGWFRG